jgi:16S rRNA (adenine1518-N6/adenine1519-N6)-dimethyltransferase
MLQKEVAERVAAQPATKAYGPLAVASAAFADVRVVAVVSPNSFFPPPRVRSAILRLDFVDPPRISIADERFFFRVVTGSLRERRKTLFNALSSALSDFPRDRIRLALQDASIDEGRRGETLTATEFARIAAALTEEEHGG